MFVYSLRAAKSALVLEYTLVLEYQVLQYQDLPYMAIEFGRKNKNLGTKG